MTLIILVLVYLSYAIDRTLPIIIANEIKTEFKLSDKYVGIYTGAAYGLAYGIFGLIIGPFIDRFNRIRLLAGMLLIWSALTAVGAWVVSYGQLVSLRFAVGAAEAGGSPTSLGILSDTFPPHRRGWAMGWYKMGTPIGFFVASAGGGWIASEYGWRTAMVAAGIPGIVLGLVIMFLLNDPPRGGLEGASANDVRPFSLIEAIRTLIDKPGLAGFILGLSIYTCSNLGLQSFIIPFYIRLHGTSLGDASLYFATASALAGVCPIAAGWLNDRLSTKGMHWPAYGCLIMSLLSWVAGSALLYVGNIIASVVFLVLWQILVVAMSVANYAPVMTLTPPGARGTIGSIMLVGSIAVGAGIGPMLTGTISDLLGDGIAVREAGLAILTLNVAAAGSYLWAARSIRSFNRNRFEQISPA